jgi:L-lysine exporter family protein LysE/ArgO
MFKFVISQPLFEGFFLGISLIAAIGAQNLFVLKQGIKGEYVFTTILVSSLCDFSMIAVGTMGAGALISSVPGLRISAVFCGIIFLLYYGLKSCINLIQGKSLEFVLAAESVEASRKTVVLSAMGFSLLNPHAVLDGVVLIGGLSAQYLIFTEKILFTVGAGFASVIWFFILGYGAKMLGPLFVRHGFAKALDVLVAGIMFGIAWSLAKKELFLLE